MIWIHAWLHCRTGRSGGSGSAGSGGSRSWISISSWISSFRIVWISSESLSELAADHLTAWIIYLLMNLSEKSCWCDDLTLHIRLPPLESLFLFFYANAPPPPKEKERKKTLVLELYTYSQRGLTVSELPLQLGERHYHGCVRIELMIMRPDSWIVIWGFWILYHVISWSSCLWFWRRVFQFWEIW